MEKFKFEKAPEFTGPEYELLISDAKSIEELFQILDDMKNIPGSREIFTAERMKKRIAQVRHGRNDSTLITRTYGLRDAVERLLPTDRIFNKYGKKKLENTK